MTNTPQTSLDTAPQGLSPRWMVVRLLAIVALGLALRLYRLGAESVWWDEFASLTHLGAPSLWEFLKLNRTLDPATLPLYYGLEYLWRHYVSVSVYGLRLFSILLGMAGIPLLYVFGRDVFGKRAGLAAALCMAVSPNHVYHAQGIRMYVLMTLLALLSAYTFMRLVQSWERRWAAAHVLSNLFLVWTHPFALLLIGVEAGFLILFRRRPLRHAAAWIGAHCLIVAPLALYLSRVEFWPQESTSSWLNMPTLAEFLGDLFADDIVSFTYQLRLSDYWSTSALRHGADVALAAALAACMIGLAWHGYRYRQTNPGRFQVFLFLLAWLVAPATALYAASMLGRPCIFPRYTLHSSLALYLILGGAIAIPPKTWASIAAAAVVAGLIGLQWIMLQPGPQRTDWQSAAAMVRSQGKAGDLILVRSKNQRDVFEYNFDDAGGSGPRPLALPIAFGESARVLAGQAGFFLDRCRQSDAGNDRVVWAVVLTPYFDSGPNLEFEDYVRTEGLAFTRTEFGGVQHVLVYQIASAGSGPIQAISQPPEDAAEISKELADLGLELAEARDCRLAQAAFDWVFEYYPPSRGVYGNLQRALESNSGIEAAALAVRAMLEAWSDEARHDAAGAREAFSEAIRHDPNYALAYANLARVHLTADNDEAAALECLRTACTLDPDLNRQWGRFVTLMTAQDYREIARQVEPFRAIMPPDLYDWIQRRVAAAQGADRTP